MPVDVQAGSEKRLKEMQLRELPCLVLVGGVEGLK